MTIHHLKHWFLVSIPLRGIKHWKDLQGLKSYPRTPITVSIPLRGIKHWKADFIKWGGAKFFKNLFQSPCGELSIGKRLGLITVRIATRQVSIPLRGIKHWKAEASV